MANRFDRLQEDVLERDPSSFPVVSLDEAGKLLHAARTLMTVEMDDAARETLARSHEVEVLAYLSANKATFKTLERLDDYVSLYRQAGFLFTPLGMDRLAIIRNSNVFQNPHDVMRNELNRRRSGADLMFVDYVGDPPRNPLTLQEAVDRTRRQLVAQGRGTAVELGNRIHDEMSAWVAERETVNFGHYPIGTMVPSDDPENNRINIEISGAGTYESGGVSPQVPRRGPLNFQGNPVVGDLPGDLRVPLPTSITLDREWSQQAAVAAQDPNYVLVHQEPIWWQTDHRVEYANQNGDVIMTSEPMNVAYESVWGRTTTPLEAYIRTVEEGTLFTGPLTRFNQAGLVQQFLTMNPRPPVPERISQGHQILLDEFVRQGRAPNGWYHAPVLPALHHEVHVLRSRTDPQYNAEMSHRDIREPLDHG